MNPALAGERRGAMEREGYWSRPQRLSRRRFGRYVALGGAALTGSSLLGCSTAGKKSASSSSAGASATAASQPQSGGTYNGALASNAPLDPQKLSQQPTDAIAGSAMSRPFRYKSGPDPSTITNHDVESDLALSAESPDAITWTLKLRPDANFQNIAPVSGRAVEAEDIKSTYVRALGLPQNPNRGALGMIDPDQIQTPDKSTVVFKLKYPYAPFKGILASPAYSWIFPREALAGTYDPSKQVIGSGPFTLETATPDVEYVVKRNPNWFEKGRPYVDGVRLAVITAQSQQLAQFSSGHLDEVQVPSNDLDTMKKTNPNAAVITTVPTYGGNIYLQLGDPESPFVDVRVRRALSMAIDRDALAKAIFNNQYVNSLFVPSNLGKWALKPNQLDASVAQYYKYNPSEAKRLLQEAGAANLSIKFAFTTNSSGADVGRNAIAEALNNMINAIGIKTTPVPLDFAKDYIDSGKGYRQGYYPKDTVLYGNSQNFTEVDDYIFGYFDSKSTQNEEHLSDPALDAMIEKARTIVDESARLQAYLDIQRYVADKVFIIPAGWGYGYTMVQGRVQNYNVGSANGVMSETYAKLWLKA
jgi:peptide/nickel transport system substrate-binding protein